MSLEVLLCDADGNLFPSEEPAFAASAEVTNRLLAELGIERRFEAAELRNEAVGRNFRSTAIELAARYGAPLAARELERYVEEERREVTAHLARTLAPDPDVLEPVALLAERLRLAVVSSSATSRLDACFRATALAPLFPPELRFSAEDSLAVPASKPDPAVYSFAVSALGVSAGSALAIEDAVAGVRSAAGAGVPVVGNLIFVPPEERAQRAAALVEAGARVVVGSWWELVELLGITRAAAA
ncbi:MAG TPA: HAD family phosphatase [Thermoleophilaceae bacterium]|nr:HAD family phosphatase [Thermoleophilaceae bacterium]